MWGGQGTARCDREERARPESPDDSGTVASALPEREPDLTGWLIVLVEDE